MRIWRCGVDFLSKILFNQSTLFVPPASFIFDVGGLFHQVGVIVQLVILGFRAVLRIVNLRTKCLKFGI